MQNKTLPNLDAVLDSKGFVTDLCWDYYNSKYQFSDFKKIVLLKHSKQLNRHPNEDLNMYWSQSKDGVDFCFDFLVKFYSDLDVNLTRLKEGYNDPMFIRFICKIGAFTSEYHWQMLLRNWNRGYSFAIARYYGGAHQNYCSDSVSYIAYFDMFFSNYLYYAIQRADQHLYDSVANVDLRYEQQVRLAQTPDNYFLNSLVVE